MSHENLSAALASCAKEQIHIPGKIQPHGVLLTFRQKDLCLVQVSANCADVFACSSDELLGKSLASFLAPHCVTDIEVALGSERLSGHNPHRIKTTNSDVTYDGILHRSGDLVVLELEKAETGADSHFRSFYQQAGSLAHEIQLASTLEEAYQATALAIQQLTSYDRVLVYRFDGDWNGQVVGEAKQPDQSAYLDLRYPASDIPAQARQLYQRNWIRIIPDVDYKPSPLIPEVIPETGAPLDLSHSVLRSVSPVHIQYLKNFGARASLSISIIKGGELWGLITCTHRQARFVPFRARSACEFLGQILSVQLVNLESHAVYERRIRVREIALNLSRQANENGVVSGLVKFHTNLLDLVPAAGAALVFGDEIYRLGATPKSEEIRKVVTWIRQNRDQSLFCSESLPSLFPAAERFKDMACGILSAALDLELGEYLIWFQPEMIKTVKWGGDPNKPLEFNAKTGILTPRHSFALWQEQVRLQSKKWEAWEIEGADDLRRSIIDLIQRQKMIKLNKALEEKTTNLANLNKAKDEFLAAVSHDLRTPLNVIMGYAEVLQHVKPGTEGFEVAVDAIARNAKTQAQLIADLLDVSRIITDKLSLDHSKIEIKGLVSDALDSIRFSAQSKKIRVESQIDQAITYVTGDANRLKQVLWNLLSNAIKFTPPGGMIKLEVERRASAVDFCVSDTGRGIDPKFLPYVFDRFKQESTAMASRHGGLGLGLAIVRHIVEKHGGAVYAESPGSGRGSTFVVSIPIRAAIEDSEDLPGGWGQAPEPQRQVEGQPLRGRTILTLDDEADTRVLLTSILERAGAAVMVAASVQEAVDRYSQHKPDVIISDINLGEEDGSDFMRALRELERGSESRAIPAIALTAYVGATTRQRALAAGFQILLAKPVLSSELISAVCSLI